MYFIQDLSTKEISRYWPDKVKEIKAAIAEFDLEEGGHIGFEAERVLEVINDILGFDGVEGWATDMQSGVQYCNTGETYDPTVIFVSTSRNTGYFCTGSWGDLLEANPELDPDYDEDDEDYDEDEDEDEDDD